MAIDAAIFLLKLDLIFTRYNNQQINATDATITGVAPC